MIHMQPFEQAWTLLKQAVFPGTAQWEQQKNNPYIPEAHIDVPRSRLDAARWEKNKRMREGGDKYWKDLAYTEERDRYNRVRDENTFTVPGDQIAYDNAPRRSDYSGNPRKVMRDHGKVPDKRVHYIRQRSDMTHPTSRQRNPDTGELPPPYSSGLPRLDRSLWPTLDPSSYSEFSAGVRGPLKPPGLPKSAFNPNVPKSPENFMDASNRAAQAEWRGDDAAL